MYQYRQILTRMRQGDSDREIARYKVMGRKKIADVREIALAQGWLTADAPLPDDSVMATVLLRKQILPARKLRDTHILSSLLTFPWITK